MQIFKMTEVHIFYLLTLQIFTSDNGYLFLILAKPYIKKIPHLKILICGQLIKQKRTNSCHSLTQSHQHATLIIVLCISKSSLAICTKTIAID